MSKLIRILQPTPIYTEHSLSSRKIRDTAVDEYIPYKRIKLREKVRWYEVILDNEKLGYVRKDNTTVFKCSYVELEDDESHGFNYKLKTDKTLDFNAVFFPKRDLVPVDDDSDNTTVKNVEVKQIKDLEKNKARYIDLYYNKNTVEVERFFFNKKEKFHLTYEPDYSSKEVLIEVNNFKDKKGYLLKKTNHGLVSDKWMTYLSYVIITICTVATFLACLATGWLVIGFVLIIPGIIIGFLIMLVLQIAISILKGIFNEIYVRL